MQRTPPKLKSRQKIVDSEATRTRSRGRSLQFRSEARVVHVEGVDEGNSPQAARNGGE